MKKIILLIFFIILFTQNAGYCVIDAATGEDVKGYKGQLPDLTERFQRYIPQTAKPQFKSIDAFNVSSGYKPVPRDNPSYINVILKKEKVSEFANDINQLIPNIEKLISSIENNENEQLFAARANDLYDNVEYLRKKYQDAPERFYPAYNALITVANRAKAVVSIRNEAMIYDKYLPYQTEGYMYTPQYIGEQLTYLHNELTETVNLMKDVN